MGIQNVKSSFTSLDPIKVLIFGYKEFSQLMSSIFPKTLARAQFKIVDEIVGSLSGVQQYIDDFNPDVIVSAGSNAAYLASALVLPVESIQTSERDIVNAVTKAAKVSKNIVLINFAQPSVSVPLLAKTLDVDITEHIYRTADEAREYFHIARAQSDVVFVGASLVCGLAAQHKIPSFFLYSVSSCEAALNRALERGEEYRRQREQQALTHWLLNQSKTPIIWVDPVDERVTFNQAAKSQLQLSADYHTDLLPLLSAVEKDPSADGECTINQRDWWYHQDDVFINNRHCYVYQFYPKKADSNAKPAALRESHRMVYRSAKMVNVMSQIEAFAYSPSNVLIFGESGTGKELIARAIHQHSPFAQGQFVALNCSAIPSELFEGELFGYQDGAYTGSRRGGRKGLIEEADRGLLFLDEISELSLEQQAKLLRFMQERRYRPLGGNQERDISLKLVAASNRPLKQMVEAGTFREDLYFRLNVFNIDVPPLRDRHDDILLIAEFKLANLAQQYGLAFSAAQILPFIAQLLCGYTWPGNIRELENVLERAVAWLHSRNSLDGLASAMPQIANELFTAAEPAVDSYGLIKHTEDDMIRAALQRFNGNKKQTAAYLGISATTLWRRLKAFNYS
ncbi:sigma 54-interacting transcriptional regulator [Rheinheimera sp. UJ63]|uniref:sigma 54-interacting transcriptional regulator n=1 Tax=Rheinheimera sp. UJ63 TaxID=2910157 RepID=UPI001F440D92|nr:sigma 54-interacting transcriptional regulator [Rheinheimera sp. UJ63]MCF4008964.1 sigma-54-dependent Fis family transcriptional regulator [Rheinheimera sp. UJ63]